MLSGGPGLMDPNGPGMMAGILVSLTISTTMRTESVSTELKTAHILKGNGMMHQVEQDTRALSVHTSSKHIFSLILIGIQYLNT